MPSSLWLTTVGYCRPQRRTTVTGAAFALVTVVLLSAGCGGSSGGSSASTTTGSSALTASPQSSVTSDAASSSNGSTSLLSGAKSALASQLSSVSGAIKVGDVSLVARATASKIKIYSSPTASTVVRSLPAPLPSGAPLVFLVQQREGDRLRVLLPIRPNESQGWIDASAVSLSEVDYRITVSTGKHELRLYHNGTLIMREPVGLGEGTTPTPGGVFYLKELLRPSNPAGAYGPYAYGLSGYSNVLHEFLGSDGQIGLHGTNDPASVGKDVSHGCIRMRNAAITKLAKLLPLGVPVQMIT